MVLTMHCNSESGVNENYKNYEPSNDVQIIAQHNMVAFAGNLLHYFIDNIHAYTYNYDTGTFNTSQTKFLLEEVIKSNKNVMVIYDNSNIRKYYTDGKLVLVL